MKLPNQSKTLAVTSILLTGLMMTNPAIAKNWQFHAGGIIAKKSMDEDGWHGIINNNITLNQDTNLGALFDVQRSTWPVSLAADIFVTADSRSSGVYDEAAVTIEMHLGVRKYWNEAGKGWQPYVGGGLAFSLSDLETSFYNTTISDDDSDVGFWAGGGGNLYLNEHWYLGLDVRYSTGTLEIGTQKRDLDGVMTGLTVGFAW